MGNYMTFLIITKAGAICLSKLDRAGFGTDKKYNIYAQAQTIYLGHKMPEHASIEFQNFFHTFSQ